MGLITQNLGLCLVGAFLNAQSAPVPQDTSVVSFLCRSEAGKKESTKQNYSCMVNPSLSSFRVRKGEKENKREEGYLDVGRPAHIALRVRPFQLG